MSSKAPDHTYSGRVPSTFVLTLSCPDRPGLVYAVTRWIAEAGGNILDSQQFSDTSDEEFFLRVHFTVVDSSSAAELSERFALLAAEHRMAYRLVVAET